MRHEAMNDLGIARLRIHADIRDTNMKAMSMRRRHSKQECECDGKFNQIKFYAHSIA